MRFRTAYDNEFDYNVNGIDMMMVDPDTGELVYDVGKTRQEQAVDADINVIVKRYGLTGQLPLVRPKIPLEADFRDAGDFDLGSALRFVREANDAFMAYPADVRAKFDNDPAKFVAFVENPSNKDECVRLGILPKDPPPVVKEVVDVRVIADPSPPK